MKRIGKWVRRVPRGIGAAIIRKVLLWGIVPLVSLYCLVAGGALLFCWWQQEALLTKIEATLQEHTGMQWEVGGPVVPGFFPPALVVENIALDALSEQQKAERIIEKPLVFVRKASAHLDIYMLLQKSFRLKRLHVEQPEITLGYDQSGRPVWEALPSTLSVSDTEKKSALVPALPEAVSQPEDLSVGTLHDVGSGVTRAVNPVIEDLTEQEQKAAFLDSLALLFREQLRDSFVAYCEQLTIQQGAMTVYDQRGKKTLQASGFSASIASQDDGVTVALGSELHVPSVDLKVKLNTELESGVGDEILLGKIEATLALTPYESPAVEGQMRVVFAWEEYRKRVQLTEVHIEAEGDSLDGQFVVDLLDNSCKGPVVLHNLSLPRWFRFGRNLPPGLQHSLHMLQGTFDLVYQGDSIYAENLQGSLAGLPVTARVWVNQLTKPVVEADIQIDQVDVDAMLPVLATLQTRQPEKTEPVFSFPYLAPYPEAPLAEGEEPLELIDVGYDVRVKVKQAQLHELTVTDATVRIVPAENNEDVCRVAFNIGRIAEGSAKGYLDIASNSVDMQFSLASCKLDLLPENAESSVRVGGKASGNVSIQVPVTDGSWAKTWKMRSAVTIGGFTLGSGTPPQGWSIQAQSLEGKQDGVIGTEKTDGISISGAWQAQLRGFSSSWNPSGKENIDANLQGSVSWAPVPGGLSLEEQKVFSQKYGGIDQVRGVLAAEGSCTARLGTLLVPVKGRMQGNLDWQVNKDTLQLQKATLDGLGSFVGADVSLVFSETDVKASVSSQYKIGLRALLEAWGLLPGKGVLTPEILEGTATVTADSDQVVFSPMQMQLDGAPLQGRIVCSSTPFGTKALSGLSLPAILTPAQEQALLSATEGEGAHKITVPGQATAEKGSSGSGTTTNLGKQQQAGTRQGPRRVQRNLPDAYWTIELSGTNLDFDKFFPQLRPEDLDKPPSAEPWDLTFVDGLNLDVLLKLDEARYKKMRLKNSLIGLRLEGKRYNLRWDTKDFYNGRALATFTGSFALPSRLYVQKGSITATHFMLGEALHDYDGSSSYGGTGSFVTDFSGAMKSEAEMPAGLSGSFSFEIKDGTYPAFLASETAGLRNTFSHASLSGPLDKGVMRWENFVLSGLMVDMTGHGWADLTLRKLDMTMNVTLAKVPTVPVRVSGSFASPSMAVRGGHFVVETAQAAGSTVLSIIKGIFDLPAQAVQGVGSLFSSGQEEKTTKVQPHKVPKPEKNREKKEATSRGVPPPLTGGQKIEPRKSSTGNRGSKSKSLKSGGRVVPKPPQHMPQEGPRVVPKP